MRARSGAEGSSHELVWLMGSDAFWPTIWKSPYKATSRLRHRIPSALRATLQPGDVLLVEGNNHISGVIKYLTQSTWSHAALLCRPDRGPRHR